MNWNAYDGWNAAQEWMKIGVSTDCISTKIRKIPYYGNKFVGYLAGNHNGDYQNV